MKMENNNNNNITNSRIKDNTKDNNNNNSNNERIFVPLLDSNGENSKISEHFGHAPFFGIYLTKTKEFEIKKNILDHSDTTKTPVDQVIEAANPTLVFTLGIGQRAKDLFAAKNIEIKTGTFVTLKDVIENINNLKSQNKSCEDTPGHVHEHNCNN